MRHNGHMNRDSAGIACSSKLGSRFNGSCLIRMESIEDGHLESQFRTQWCNNVIGEESIQCTRYRYLLEKIPQQLRPQVVCKLLRLIHINYNEMKSIKVYGECAEILQHTKDGGSLPGSSTEVRKTIAIITCYKALK